MADPAEGQTPNPGTGNADAPTLTQAHADKLVSDALSKAGRDAQTLSAERAQLDTARAEHDSGVLAFQARQDEAADAAYKDNPQALGALRTKREFDRGMAELKRDQEALKTERTTLTARESSISKQTHATLAAKISAEFGVAIEPLLNNTDGSEEQTRALAPALTKTATPAGDDTPPDSGAGGGGVGITLANIDNLMTRITEFSAPQQEAIRNSYRQVMLTGKLT